MADIIGRIGGQTGDSAAFLFKSLDAVGLTGPTPQLLFEPWQRAGFPPLCIADASAPT